MSAHVEPIVDAGELRDHIRAMYREDRFGWSRRLQGANDYRSMAAGNTSAGEKLLHTCLERAKISGSFT